MTVQRVRREREEKNNNAVNKREKDRQREKVFCKKDRKKNEK